MRTVAGAPGLTVGMFCLRNLFYFRQKTSRSNVGLCSRVRGGGARDGVGRILKGKRLGEINWDGLALKDGRMKRNCIIKRELYAKAKMCSRKVGLDQTGHPPAFLNSDLDECPERQQQDGTGSGVGTESATA